jgi:hypothetical protein
VRDIETSTPSCDGGGSSPCGSGAGWAAAVDETWRMPYWMNAALVARADQQHAWVLAGDDRGISGEYPPKQIAIDAGSIAHQRLRTSEAVFGPWDL